MPKVFSFDLMAIIRTVRKETFTSICNDLLNDTSITFRAKGLLCYLISRPPNWNANVVHLSKTFKEGKDAIYSIVNELIEAGYIKRFQKKDRHGRVGQMEYHVFERPQRDIPEADSPLGEKPDLNNNGSIINTEGSKGPDKPANAKDEENTPVQRKIKFVESILHWVADNDNKYPKLMYMEFIKYWMEQSAKLKKVKLRFEEQRFFDIGRRLSTWFQKCNDKTLTDYWEQEKKLAPLNELCRSLFPKNPPTNPS